MSLVLDVAHIERKQRFCFTSRPNCSLNARARRRVFWAIALVTLLIASVFSALGYWLTLPFAGLEIGVLAWAFDCLGRRHGDYETLTIDDGEVIVERSHEGRLERQQFNREWVSLVQRHGQGRLNVALRSQGRETELGMFLTDEARAELAAALLTRIRETR